MQLTPNALSWLSIILKERFGHSFVLQHTDAGVVLSIPSQGEGQIIFPHTYPVFFESRSDIPFTTWDGEAEGWQCVLGGISATELAGEAITAVLLNAPGNGAAIGGIKVCTENGWFAARPSGTEALYKIYAESFIGEAHLQLLIDEAQGLLAPSLRGA